MKTGLAGLVVAVAMTLFGARAHAEGAVACGLARTIPAAGYVPANTASIRLEVQGTGSGLTPDSVRLFRREEGSEINHRISVRVLSTTTALIEVLEPLLADKEYVLAYPSCYYGNTTSFFTRAAAEVPASLGQLEVSPLYSFNGFRGDPLYYVVNVRLTNSAEADAWAGSLERWLTINGTEWARNEHWPLERQVNEWKVSVDCGGAETSQTGLVGGPYQVQAHAGAPSGNPDIISNEVNGAIDCARAIRVAGYDDYRPLSPEEIEYWDTPGTQPDPIVPDVDGGVPEDDSRRRVEYGGCEVSATGEGLSGSASAWNALAALVMVCVGRSRRAKKAR